MIKGGSMAENEELLEEMSEGEARQKILVADDEASIRRILETRLKMVGYDVVVADGFVADDSSQDSTLLDNALFHAQYAFLYVFSLRQE